MAIGLAASWLPLPCSILVSQQSSLTTKVARVYSTAPLFPIIRTGWGDNNSTWGPLSRQSWWPLPFISTAISSEKLPISLLPAILLSAAVSKPCTSDTVMRQTRNAMSAKRNMVSAFSVLPMLAIHLACVVFFSSHSGERAGDAAN